MSVKAAPVRKSKSEFKDKEKPAQIRASNIVAAKGRPIILTVTWGTREKKKMYLQIGVNDDGEWVMKE